MLNNMVCVYSILVPSGPIIVSIAAISIYTFIEMCMSGCSAGQSETD